MCGVLTQWEGHLECSPEARVKDKPQRSLLPQPRAEHSTRPSESTRGCQLHRQQLDHLLDPQQQDRLVLPPGLPGRYML